MWRPSLVFASLVLAFSPTLSLAQGSNDVAYLAFSAEDLALRNLQSRARLAMLAEGVGAVDPSKILELGDVVDDRVKWLGAATRRACSGGQSRSATQFDSDLSSLLESLDFGEYETAKVKGAALYQSLPCLTEFLSDEQIQRFWFLLASLRFGLGEVSAAEAHLMRAAQVAPLEGLAAGSSESLMNLASSAQRRALDAPETPFLFGLTGAEARVDGRAIDLADEIAQISVPLGIRLVQVQVGDRVESSLVELDGTVTRPGVPTLTIVDSPTLQRGLLALGDGPKSAGEIELATGALLCWLAQLGTPYAVLVQHRRGARDIVLQVDQLSASVRGFRKGPVRGDIYGYRARLGLRGGYRGMVVGEPGGEIQEGYHYGTFSMTLWGRLSWLLRVGGEVGFSYTDNPEAAVTSNERCCFLPFASVRLRLEAPKGVVRPFGEAGLQLLVPSRPEGDEAFVAIPGIEVSGGAVITPEPSRRFGITIAGGVGVAPTLGGWALFRAGPEVRF